MVAPRRKTAADTDENGAPSSSAGAGAADESVPCPSKNPPPPTKIHHRLRRLTIRLLPPLLLAVGLAAFAESFFLSRTSFDRRSSCERGAAGDLLRDALGMERDDVDFLRRSGFLTDDLDPKTKESDDGDGGAAAAGGGGGGGGERYGCWVPRRVDSAVILVVDALRFDFARDRLPLSVGSRLFPPTTRESPSEDNDGDAAARGGSRRGTSKLYRFVADPPTVTMQRLKGLTTGGLPTFADISGSFGGASVDEDSWVEQLRDVPRDRRRRMSRTGGMAGGETKSGDGPHMAFVGDDTWVDLFPTQFDDCHPFPSFNTRDLDTVDDGCLEHLPRLLDGLAGSKGDRPNAATSSFELVVAHFLGVDHVGHTYGPNNPHMVGKLHQMDVMLSNALDTIDGAPGDSCIVALVLGDHGMTEDGNHGGGTDEEVNAGLFVHFSPGCNNDAGERVTGEEIPGAAKAFDSIHQIDLVPTISLLMGLPIPYANVGGLVPDLLPAPRDSLKIESPKEQFAPSSYATPHAVTALALNAAQVWTYLHNYSLISRDLPVDKMNELKASLDGATSVFRNAISHSRRMMESKTDEFEGEYFFDSSAYRQACGLFKLFLAESTDLGKRVWTQFNERGMMLGIGILAVAWIMGVPLWKGGVRHEIFWANRNGKKRGEGSIKENVKRSNDDGPPFSNPILELLAAILFMIFQCGVLTFSNSYIEHEGEIVTFFLSVLCLMLFLRYYFASDKPPSASAGHAAAYLPLIVAACSRANDVLVSGHGLDPSLRLHSAHHPIVFSLSLLVLAMLRVRWSSHQSKNNVGSETAAITFSVAVDIAAIIFLGISWFEKRALDQSRNGFVAARFAMVGVFAGLAHSLFALVGRRKTSGRQSNGGRWEEHAQLSLFRAMLFVVIVTGPSTASTAVLMVVQFSALRSMTGSRGPREVTAPVMAAIWRLVIRHVFFATNHHCSFSRLQYSAAFVASDTFQFYVAGASLFMNTFGWEIIGSTLVLVCSRTCRADPNNIDSSESHVWDWFRFYQWTEMLASCMSVSLMKRHLMVWAIFAPRFMFAAVFTVVGLILWVADVCLMEFCDAPLRSNIHKTKKQIS